LAEVEAIIDELGASDGINSGRVLVAIGHAHGRLGVRAFHQSAFNRTVGIGSSTFVAHLTSTGCDGERGLRALVKTGHPVGM
jgi:hypothetical protein